MSSDALSDPSADVVAPFEAPAETLEVLAHPRRARTIAILREHETSLAPTDLATHLVARENDVPLVDVSESEHERALVALHHSHLPALSEHDLVEWDRAAGTVDLGAAAPDPRSEFGALFESDSATADVVFAALSNGRRRALLSVLADLDGATAVTDLAGRIAAREAGTDPESVDAADRRRVEISLHHAHLPALDRVGLVAYDPDGGDVALADHPLLGS